MFLKDKRPQINMVSADGRVDNLEAGCLYALITGRRPVSRRNRASWYLNQLNKLVRNSPIEALEEDDKDEDEAKHKNETREPNKETKEENKAEATGVDIKLISITPTRIENSPTSPYSAKSPPIRDRNDSQLLHDQQYLVTPNTRVLYLSRSIATSIILDLSPSVVSVSSQNGCVFLDSMFDALKRVLHLLVKSHEIPSSGTETSRPFVLGPKVFVSVIAYTPFIVAKNNQVLVQNRRISSTNIDQVLVEIWICLNRLTQEIYELVSNTCENNNEFNEDQSNVFIFPHPKLSNSGVLRQPGAVLEDIFELGLFSSSLMPRLSRLSLIVISDGLFASTNNLNTFRLQSIAVSFVSLGADITYPDACFGYTPYIDLMKFIAKTTLGVYLSHQDLINLSQTLSKSKQIPLLRNPLCKLFCWTLHSERSNEEQPCDTPKAINVNRKESNLDPLEISSEQIARFFCLDQPVDTLLSLSGDKSMTTDNTHTYHDWRSFKLLDRNLDADFEQVLACLLREGYLIKSIHFRRKEATRIVARLVLHWRHNLDLEQELVAPYWNTTDPYDINDSNQLILRTFDTPLYGDTYCEIIVHGSYSFLHNLYCNKRTRIRRSEYRDTSYKQYRQLIDSVMQTQERLQYLSRFYRDSSLSKVPSFLLHGNSLLYEQPHTHKLTATVENVLDETKTNEFQEYWQKISCLDTKSWKNLMHIHTLRLVLEHDQPKHKNIHYQNSNGRYTHVQCRRALSAISNFIKSYSSFALLEDTTYIKFIYNKDDDLREIETSATKGFIVIRINKLLPIVVIYLMFTSGILDSHRIQIVSYLENQLVNCKLRNMRSSTVQMDSIIKTKTISPSGEMCCVLIKSPLERMLKVYSRNFIGDFLIHNMAHGLPGSCPYTTSQSFKITLNDINNPQTKQTAKLESKENPEGYLLDNSIARYNLVFGKYLYGVRIVQTITNLPQDLITSLAANVLSKISAILVNIRIKQGFHIAFNNSGILNLVVELAMKDHSNQDHASSCLCQYIVFPPTITSCPVQSLNTVLNTSQANTSNVITSKPGSLSGSLANSDSYMKSAQDSNTHIRSNKGEIKMIKEYWIEQQYGLSYESENYHKSLQGLRHSEVVDHLFITDSSIFDCLLTYDLLQLMCDKLSLYHDLDSSMTQEDSKPNSLFSPTTSTNSSNVEQHEFNPSTNHVLPSTLIDGNTKDGNSKVPLLETEYNFSVMKFLDYCQQASLNVLLFRDSSEHYEQVINDSDNPTKKQFNPNNDINFEDGLGYSSKIQLSRKLSADTNECESEVMKKEHRSSYQLDNLSCYTYSNLVYSPSLNHMFLETLHKRLKQMHDKELKLSDFDLLRLPLYLKRRKLFNEERHESDTDDTVFPNISTSTRISLSNDCTNQDSNDDSPQKSRENEESINEREDDRINWRCFLRKGNQENLMIVLIPATLGDVTKWLNYVNSPTDTTADYFDKKCKYDPVCPIFVFRCSSTMINDHVMSFLKDDLDFSVNRTGLEVDMSLHFGQPCKYMGQLKVYNDELNNEILPIVRSGAINQATSDEKTLEVVHFRAFLRKIKNTVLKSRFSSLNDAYLSELFVHKDDLLYYINNVDMDTQKKYHVSSQLKSLSEFIKSYVDYSESLPKEPVKPCNQLLNSILLQKCGLFINQPIARYNESNPLIKQMHDKKLLFLMRCNYKVELPILEENLATSTLLKNFLRSNNSSGPNSFNAGSLVMPSSSGSGLSASIGDSANVPTMSTVISTSLGRNDGAKLMDLKSGSVGAIGSPTSSILNDRQPRFQQNPRLSSNTALNSLSSSSNGSLILEAFRGLKSCSIKEVDMNGIDSDDICLRHEAHMAEVLMRTGERKESHQYRRVLKSKGNYNQSHGAIDQALKRVDSLGRLEHFCLTPLLFSPGWRTKLAPVRDHTIESSGCDDENHYENSSESRINSNESDQKSVEALDKGTLTDSYIYQQEADEKWHQMVCNNYIKEYEQYIQTLGFNSVQVRYQQSNSSKAGTSNQSSRSFISKTTSSAKKSAARQLSQQLPLDQATSPKTSSILQASSSPTKLKRSSISTSTGSLIGSTTNPGTYNTGYLIKFLNSGCLVFKVGFCRPYVYSILYSIEGERFNNSNIKLNMTAFLDELDNIKVTMHLHSFTYDYHLRSMYSYIAGRQLTFSPGYHLISFLDDFGKYYQKAPNYARNHILSGEVCISDLKVSGQQLYNYIVTHNMAYKMDVLEMTTQVANLVSDLSSRTFIEDQKLESSNIKDTEINLNRNHANDYVLIELKREKVRYKDGKEPDIFDCGLLITHDHQQTNLTKSSLTLKYFLLLTNQRDLYPKLIQTYDSIISLGCHRPIRLGLAQSIKQSTTLKNSNKSISNSVLNLPYSDLEESSELQSSGEMSGPQSIISTANSTQSSNSGLQFGGNTNQDRKTNKVPVHKEPAQPVIGSVNPLTLPKIKVGRSEDQDEIFAATTAKSTKSTTSGSNLAIADNDPNHLGSSMEDSSISGETSPILRRKRYNSAGSGSKKNNIHERTICDEEITYLGYFSSDEMDVLKFLQQKTDNLKSHIEQIVRLAEIHYRRDYLWHKLMQRTAVSAKSDDISLTVDELIQLLGIVEAIDLAVLDPQLSVFTTMHITWYIKLLKAFSDLKQSNTNQHRIYTVKASKLLLLYIDPNCTTAFILLTIDSERGSVEMDMLLKDKQEINKSSPTKLNNSEQKNGLQFELDQECRQLVNDFINFCATFMWSTFLN